MICWRLLPQRRSRLRCVPEVQAAFQATQDGLAAKAVREYAAAFKASPSHADVGLRAARLLIARNELLEGVRILNEMKTQLQPLDAGIASQVDQILADNAHGLEEIFQEQAKAGWADLDAVDAVKPAAADLTNAVGHFRTALQARYQVNPGSGSDLDAKRSPYIGLALSAAAAGDLTNAIHSLTLASKAGLKVDGYYFASPLWNQVRRQADFQQFLRDAFGEQTAATAATDMIGADFIGKWDFLHSGNTERENPVSDEKLQLIKLQFNYTFAASPSGELILANYLDAYILKDIDPESKRLHSQGYPDNTSSVISISYPPGIRREGGIDGSELSSKPFRIPVLVRYKPEWNLVSINGLDGQQFLVLDSTKTRLVLFKLDPISGKPNAISMEGKISEDQISRAIQAHNPTEGIYTYAIKVKQ